jgi:hypothetical protein
MASVDLPESVTVGIMKKANVPAVSVDLTRLSKGAIQNVLTQGLKYFFDARLSHKAKATGEASEGPEESVQKVLDRLYAPEWVVRARSEAAEEELSLEDRALLMAIEPRFQKAGVIWRASKKAGKEARTVLNVVDELGGSGDDAWEVDADKIPAAVDGAWKKIQEEARDHLKSLKRQAAAAF